MLLARLATAEGISSATRAEALLVQGIKTEYLLNRGHAVMFPWS